MISLTLLTFFFLLVLICFFFLFFLRFLKKKQLKLLIVYIFFTFFYLFSFFFFREGSIFYWIIKIISQNGQKLIILGDGQEIFYFLIEISFFLSFLIIIPLILFFVFFVSLTFWTAQQKKDHFFILKLGLYFFCIVLWCFYQDIGFANWDIYYLKENYEKNINSFWNFLDYQPQLENLYFLIKTEIIDFFLWQFFIFICISIFLNNVGVFLKCLTYLNNILNIHFFFLCLFLLSSYFFFGGDGINITCFFLFFSWFLFEFCIFSFCFFFWLKKFRFSFSSYWGKRVN